MRREEAAGGQASIDEELRVWRDANRWRRAQRPYRPGRRAPLRLLLLLRRRDRADPAAQEPLDYIKTEEFDAISDYLIPKPQLCGRLLTLRAFGHVVLCWPTCIENNKKYARNALIFSLGLVL